jgi:hypothetical protein
MGLDMGPVEVRLSTMGTAGLKLGPRRAELAGRRFGKLVVEAFVGVNDHGHATWLCLCDCGNKTTVSTGILKRSWKRSCGCLRRGDHWNRRGNLRHGHTTNDHGSRRQSATYRTWGDMIQRCTNPKQPNYRYYGGRGITICERWLAFDNFLADMGERPDGLEIDRINNDGNYEPGNCRWATRSQQVRNRRRKEAM